VSPARIKRRKWILYGVASVLVHVTLLALILGRTEEAPASREIAVKLRAPVEVSPVLTPELPVEQFTEAKAQTSPATSASPAVQGRTGGPRQSSPAPRNVRAIVAADFASLRAELATPVTLDSPGPTRPGDGLSPVDPEIHLTDGAIDRLVRQGRGYMNEDRGGEGRVRFGGEVCGR
jgi:hypothetical protein